MLSKGSIFTFTTPKPTSAPAPASRTSIAARKSQRAPAEPSSHRVIFRWARVIRVSGRVSGWADGSSPTGSGASRAGSAGCSPVASTSGRCASLRKTFMAIQGLTTKAMASEKSMARLAPMGMGRMYGPMSPRTKAIGRMAAMTAKVARMVGLPTSSTASTTMRAKERRGPGQVEVPVDVLDHHDGVVDEDADGEDEREEGDAVQRVAEQVGEEQREGQRDRDRHGDDERRAPAHRQQDERDHRQGRDEQVLDELVRLVPGGLAVVAGRGDDDVGRDERAAQGLHLLGHALGQLGGVGAGALGDRDGHRRLEALPSPRRREDHRRLGLGAVGHPGHVLQVDGALAAGRDHRAAQLGRGEHLPARLHHEPLVPVHEGAGRQLHVGAPQRGLDLGDGDAEGPHPGGVGLDADGPARAAEDGHVGGERDAGDPRATSSASLRSSPAGRAGRGGSG